MFGNNRVPFPSSLLVLLGALLLTISTIPQAFSEDECEKKIQCEGEKLVLPKHMEEMQINCTTEWELTSDNITCSIHCIFDFLNLLNENGKPNSDAFQNFVNTEMCPSLRENARKCDCFRFAEKTTNETSCGDTSKFDTCMYKFFGNICKQAHE